jgi:hypothetical protein
VRRTWENISRLQKWLGSRFGCVSYTGTGEPNIHQALGLRYHMACILYQLFKVTEKERNYRDRFLFVC